MGIKSFLFNGGLLGMIRGYDYEKEGKPYGFEELNEDVGQVEDCCRKVTNTAGVLMDPLTTVIGESVHKSLT